MSTQITRVREFEASDSLKLEELSKRLDFPVPDMENRLYYAKTVAVSEGQLVGIGLARVTSEFILLLDPGMPRRLRVHALEVLLRAGVMFSVRQGLDEAHAFVVDDAFADLLRHKFGFVVCEGTSLYLKL